MATSSVVPVPFGNPMQQAVAPIKLPGATPAAAPPPNNLVASAVAPMSVPGASMPASTPPAPSKTPSYSLAAAPRFLQDTLPMNQVKIAPGDPNFMKGAEGSELNLPGGRTQQYVRSDDPYTIHSFDPDFAQAALNHELTHVYQDTLPGDVKFAEPNKTNPYDYGGEAGLQKALAGGKKITDFSNEQVAKMVEDHTEKTNMIMQFAKLGVLQPGDVDKYNQWKQRVGPYIKQLAGLRGKTYDPVQEQPGMISDLPEMSSRSAAVPITPRF